MGGWEFLRRFFVVVWMGVDGRIYEIVSGGGHESERCEVFEFFGITDFGLQVLGNCSFELVLGIVTRCTVK